MINNQILSLAFLVILSQVLWFSHLWTYVVEWFLSLDAWCADCSWSVWCLTKQWRLLVCTQFVKRNDCLIPLIIACQMMCHICSTFWDNKQQMKRKLWHINKAQHNLLLNYWKIGSFIFTRTYILSIQAYTKMIWMEKYWLRLNLLNQ